MSHQQGENKKMEDAKFYLTLPATKEEMEDWEILPAKQPAAIFTPTKDSTKDSFQIATLICSTKLTQNGKFDCQQFGENSDQVLNRSILVSCAIQIYSWAHVCLCNFPAGWNESRPK